MQVSLQGKRALVTGGARGIGRALTLALAASGARTAVAYRSKGEHVDRLAAELESLGGDHLLVQADVTDPEQVAALAGTCRDRLGGLDIVVSNAGTISHVPFAELSAAQWHEVVDTNLTGTFHVVQAMSPLLGAGSSVILIGSKAAAVGVPLRAHYTATKSAMTGLARSLCKEWGPRGIRVNVVAPGIVDTKELSAEQTERYRRIVALGRLGRPEEIADVVVFLGSDRSGYLTGETINVDGGT